MTGKLLHIKFIYIPRDQTDKSIDTVVDSCYERFISLPNNTNNIVRCYYYYYYYCVPLGQQSQVNVL